MPGPPDAFPKKENPPITNGVIADLEYDPSYFLDRGFSQKTIDDFDLGLYLPSDYIIHQRMMCPLYNIKGDLIGFNGRSIHPRNEWTGGFYPKDFKPENDEVASWFQKWRAYPHTFERRYNLYGINKSSAEIKKTKTAILVEGLPDTWGMWGHGVRNVVGLYGVFFTGPQKEMLKSIGCKNIVMALDGDASGWSASRRISKTNRRDFNFKIVNLPTGKDPGDLTSEEFNSIKDQLAW